MTMTVINAIVNTLTVGMDFDTTLATVKKFTDDFSAIIPSADDFGYIHVGDTWGDSVVLSFDDNDKLDNIDIGTLDDFD